MGVGAANLTALSSFFLKMEKTEAKERGNEDNIATWDCGSPLYDSFELAAICHHLDRHLMLLPFGKGSRRLTCGRRDEGHQLKVKVEKRRSKVGLEEIYKAIVAFWRKH